MRPNSEEEVDVSYTQPGHHDVDLYYIMDMSFSMKDDKEKLKELGKILRTPIYISDET